MLELRKLDNNEGGCSCPPRRGVGRSTLPAARIPEGGDRSGGPSAVRARDRVPRELLTALRPPSPEGAEL